ncbi:FAD-dependent monooxygenase [Variovorax sp. CY25R-8]|uniref:FAD-dependent monooxygenase n=1 Tax=Variovorax sp. CY25R-8 TaxID=2855501 RepID=UPI0021BB34B9|nr:FAD-dependent monooxygenase [Variovorax sp. CY25R-8]MCT8173860.1 FAD-dependent monooxygenase [Variovorax sp. CY25R-8]
MSETKPSGHAVLIAGAGPTGMMLAGELALAGVDVAILERRSNQDIEGSRAGGLHARTLEIFDQRGIVDRFLAEGQTAQVAAFGLNRLDISDFPTRHNYGLALWQKHIERILAGWIAELGVTTYREREVVGFDQDEAGVDVHLRDGQTLRAQYLVGCDGGRSVIRKAAGIEFPGWDATISHILAEAEVAEEPVWGMRHDAIGTHGLSRMDDGKTVRIMVTEREVGHADQPTLRDLSGGLIAHYGTDFGVHSPLHISRFTDMARQAASYRKGRVLLAGDAAHVHYPAGGQGLNLGVQDAFNLGWKLAQVVNGISPDSLLDSYPAERHPVGALVLRNSLAQVALRRQDGRSKALAESVSELLRMEEPRKRFAGMMSGLDIRYDLGEGHPLVGRRMPDLEVVVGGTKRWVFELMHAARPLLLDLGALRDWDTGRPGDRLRLVEASFDGKWELPVVGEVGAPGAVLIRPDGYVAWVGSGTREGLVEAIATWFGSPCAA